jgi:hypothetical protein
MKSFAEHAAFSTCLFTHLFIYSTFRTIIRIIIIIIIVVEEVELNKNIINTQKLASKNKKFST